MKSTRKWIVLLLSLVLLGGLLPQAALGAGAAEGDFIIEDGVLKSYRGQGGEVVVPEGVTEIGSGAFDRCAGLTSVTLGSGVTRIGDNAFRQCVRLTAVDLPKGVTHIGERAFDGCTALADAVLPDTVTALGDGAFNGCTGLTEMVVPDSVTDMGVGVFYNCAGVTKVTLGKGLTGVPDYTFWRCGRLASVSLPDSLTFIGTSAFRECGSLEGLSFGDSVMRVGSHAFDKTAYFNNESNWSGDCLYLNNWLIEVRSTVAAAEIAEGTRGLAVSVFTSCRDLTSVTIPEGVTILFTGTFQLCEKLEHVSIPESVTEIGAYAFQECSSLTGVTIPEQVEKIGEWAFWRCDALGTVTILSRDCEIYDAASTFGSPETATIVGYKGSTAEAYADKYSYPFEALDVDSCADGHDWDEGTVTVAPAEQAKGEKTYTCTRCGETRTEVLPPLPHVHSYTGQTVAPTCTEKGYIIYTCACGDSYADNETKPLGHHFQDGVCTRCGEKSPDVTQNPFKDVKEDAYYAAPVAWAVENGITNGTSSTTFSPDKTCTRAQVVTFLWRAEGEPEPESTVNPFTDVKPEAYYYKAVLWAVEKGITNGTGPNAFSPDKGCTRGQVVTFQWRAAGQPEPKGKTNPFTDVKSDAYYYKAVLWAVEKGVTNGTSADKFSPDSTCTRGQIVTFLYRAEQK